MPADRRDAGALRQELRPGRGARAWARAHGHTLLELAFAWLLARPPVASVIAGATKPEQARPTRRAARWTLTDADFAEIDAAISRRRRSTRRDLRTRRLRARPASVMPSSWHRSSASSSTSPTTRTGASTGFHLRPVTMRSTLRIAPSPSWPPFTNSAYGRPGRLVEQRRSRCVRRSPSARRSCTRSSRACRGSTRVAPPHVVDRRVERPPHARPRRRRCRRSSRPRSTASASACVPPDREWKTTSRCRGSGHRDLGECSSSERGEVEREMLAHVADVVDDDVPLREAPARRSTRTNRSR